MKVQTYLNEGPGMFFEYEPGDRLVLGPIVTVRPSREELDTLEKVWAIGNRMAPDLDGEEWPSFIRSLSCADVVVIGEQAYVAEHVGWAPLPTEHLTWSLDEYRSIRNERLEEARR